MIKNILALIGALTVGLVVGLIGYISFSVIQQDNEEKSGKFLVKTQISFLVEKTNEFLVSGSLCDQGQSYLNELCAKTTELEKGILEHIELIYHEVKTKCPEPVFKHLTPNLKALYNFFSLTNQDRRTTSMTLNNEQVQEAIKGSISDLHAFDFDKHCPMTTGKGTLIEAPSTDYSIPHDSSDSQ